MASSKAAPHPSGSRIPIASILKQRILVACCTWHDTQRKICRQENIKIHNRAYSIQNDHLIEGIGLSITPQGKTACFARSTSPLAAAGRSVVS